MTAEANQAKVVHDHLGVRLSPAGLVDYLRFIVVGCYLFACGMFLLTRHRIQLESPLSRTLKSTFRELILKSRSRSIEK
jgi:hypothetical protein